MGGNKKEALSLTERLVAIDAVDGTLRRAAVLQALKRDDEALQSLNTLIERFPNDARAPYQLGFLYQTAKDYGKAAEAFTAAGATTGTGSEQAEARAQAWYQIGRTAVFSGENVEAGIDALQKYLAFDGLTPDMPGTDWANFRLGELQSKNGDDAGATQSFATALKLTDDKNLRRRVKDLAD
jgi:tetratricopeptide (TPR) repeat protein